LPGDAGRRVSPGWLGATTFSAVVSGHRVRVGLMGEMSGSTVWPHGKLGNSLLPSFSRKQGRGSASGAALAIDGMSLLGGWLPAVTVSGAFHAGVISGARVGSGPSAAYSHPLLVDQGNARRRFLA
jgi:hypothetical protein